MINRRFFLLSGVAASSFPVLADTVHDRFDDLRRRLGRGARLGVAAIDTGTERTIQSDARSRFAMASTFKLALAGGVLAEADAGRLKLDELLRIRPQHMFPHAPVVRAAGAGASLSLHQLCAAAVEASDNGAANLLLQRIGGPPALTRFFRRCGDTVSRLDRYEMELNSNLPGDARDTTSPAAMLHTMRTLLLGDLLKPASRQQLTSWMVNSNRGLDRLRAGLPAGWRAGSKAGTGARGAMNDLLIAWPPNRATILIASYLDAPAATEEVRTSAHRDIAKRVTALLG